MEQGAVVSQTAGLIYQTHPYFSNTLVAIVPNKRLLFIVMSLTGTFSVTLYPLSCERVLKIGHILPPQVCRQV